VVWNEDSAFSGVAGMLTHLMSDRDNYSVAVAYDERTGDFVGMEIALLNEEVKEYVVRRKKEQNNTSTTLD
jgi:hypothetical protein